MENKFGSQPQSPTKERAETKEARTISDAELLKNGASYEGDDLVLVPTEKQIVKAKEEMDEEMRKNRVVRYFEYLDNEIEGLKEKNMLDEVDILEKRKVSDRGIIEDAVFENNKWILVPKNKEVGVAKKEMNLFEAQKAFRKEVDERERMHEEVSKINWNPINFRENVKKFYAEASFSKDEISKFDGIEMVKGFLHRGNKETPSLDGRTIEAVRDLEFGRTANNSEGITEKHLDGLETLLGEKLPRERIVAVHYTYLPTGELGAVMLTLDDEVSVSYDTLWKTIRERQQEFLGTETNIGRKILDSAGYDNVERKTREEFEDMKKGTPFLGSGSLIIKNDGKKMFLPGITYKQYPVMTAGGRVVVTFAGGPSRGIFDEDVFYASARIHSSTGKKTVSNGVDENIKDSYRWEEGSVSRGKQGDGREGTFHYGGGESLLIPKAKVKLDKDNNLLIYQLDSNSGGNFNEYPEKVLVE